MGYTKGLLTCAEMALIDQDARHEAEVREREERLGAHFEAVRKAEAEAAAAEWKKELEKREAEAKVRVEALRQQPLRAWRDRACRARSRGDLSRELALAIEDATTLSAQGDALRVAFAAEKSVPARMAMALHYARELVKDVWALADQERPLLPADLGALGDRPIWLSLMDVSACLETANNRLTVALAQLQVAQAAFEATQAESTAAPKPPSGPGHYGSSSERREEGADFSAFYEADQRARVSARTLRNRAHEASEKLRGAQNALARAERAVCTWKAWAHV